MPIVTMRELLDDAARGGYGLGAFGVSNLEQAQAIIGAAAETRSPVIMMASSKNIAYAGESFLWHIILAATEQHPDIPVAVHLDHGLSPAMCAKAIEMGFTSVMIDGSLLEDGRTVAPYDYNVRVTREVVELARRRGVTVEGELGTLGGLEDGVGSGEVHLTDPEQAVEFVEQTGVDALAVAVGTSHGAYKFPRPPEGDLLRIDRIEEIHKLMPDTHLVMHGSSSVPPDMVARINAAGGDLPPAYGVPVEQIQRALTIGVRKVNVDTDSRLAMTMAIRERFAAEPSLFDPRDYLADARAAMQAVVAERMRQFGQAGRA